MLCTFVSTGLGHPEEIHLGDQHHGSAHTTAAHAARTQDTRNPTRLRAGDILDTEPPAVLEEIRDYKGRKDTFSAFEHAWIDLVVQHLADARLRSSGCTAA
jgi:hypothetical protein